MVVAASKAGKLRVIKVLVLIVVIVVGSNYSNGDCVVV